MDAATSAQHDQGECHPARDLATQSRQPARSSEEQDPVIQPQNPLAAASQALQDAGYQDPLLEAELLASGLAGLSLGEWRTAVWQGNRTLPDGFDAAVARRVAGEPYQYIVGRAPFRGGLLQVGPGVLVPRPETEWLAELAIKAGRVYHQPTVVDLGTGSGALAWAFATELPGAQIHAVELSSAAALYAKANLTGLAVTLVVGDATDPDLLSELNGQVDLVVGNPPYLPAGTTLGPDLAHEPPEALWGGGAQGLDLPSGFLATARRLLAPGGQVFLEIDPSQAKTILVLAQQLGLTGGQVLPDLTGRPRVFQAGH